MADRERFGWNRFAPFVTRTVLPWYCLAAALVVLRCLPSLLFEQFDFDSDQAIVGLMAKHLIEGRAIPVFFYGQAYMLGVQAWIAAPFVALGGATVAMLRLPLVLVNVAAAVWLIATAVRYGASPAMAFVAALPFIAAGPLASKLLMQTLGASVEPFLYVLLLWSLRRRPLAFGAVFAVAYLHREFMLFALPALAFAAGLQARTTGAAAVQPLTQAPNSDAAPVAQPFRAVAKAAAAFGLVWLVVAFMTSRVNTLGPAGGEFARGSLFAQSEMVVARLGWSWPAYVARLRAVLDNTLPDLFGLRVARAPDVGVHATLTIGSDVGRIAFFAALAAALLGVIRDWRQPVLERSTFYVYVGAIGLETVLAYASNGGVPTGGPGVPRYVLLALLVPIAAAGACVVRRPPRALAAALAAALVGWSAVNVRDTVRIVREYVVAPPPDDYRALADYLVAHRMRYGRADYWDAYVVDFLSRERVILAPTAVTRISSYDARVDRNAANAVTVVRQPCDSGTRVASWCVDDPLHR